MRRAVQYHNEEEVSIRNTRLGDTLKLAAAVIALLAVAAVALCVGCAGNGDSERQSQPSSSPSSESDLDRYFLRDAATVEAMGLPVYWLGREFAAGDLVFQGPYVSGFGAEVTGGGIRIDYFSPAPHVEDAQLVEGPDTSLEVATYSKDAWNLVKDRWINPPTPGVTRRTVSVLGKSAEMFFAPSPPSRPLNALWLIIDLGDVVVMASAQSGGPMTPGGADYSPFINDPDLLVQVMQDLRPYPQ